MKYTHWKLFIHLVMVNYLTQVEEEWKDKLPTS